MANQKQTKLVVASIVAVASVGSLVAIMFPDEFDQLTVQLNSLWHPPIEEFTETTEPIKENKKKLSNIKNKSPELTPLNLEGSVGLDLLGEELVEDSLWEEGILRSRPEGVRSGQAVLDALNEIEGWSPIENGYNSSRLKMYLRYPKLWVRLSAYAFALKAKVLSPSDETRLARLITLKHRDNPHQVERFLTRYERKDPTLFEQLKKRLVQTSAPAVEEPATLEVEEDSADAS